MGDGVAFVEGGDGGGEGGGGRDGEAGEGSVEEGLLC